MLLRPYQARAIEDATKALEQVGSAVLQMPTGGGKTRTATEIIATEQGVVWFICHRQEIERQASSAFSAAGIDHGIISPRAKPDFTKRVQIVSVAAKCLADMPKPALVVWDECHHVPAKSWAKLHASLPGAKHLGLTATPERLDGKGLKDWFAELIVGPSISELIEQGFLSPVRYFAPSDPDLTAAKLHAGDYRKKDADAVMNSRVIIGDAVAEYKRSANGKRAIAFCTSVEASKALVDRFNAEGIPALHVDGTSVDDHRRDAVAALSSGDVKVLSNVEVFTEGFDVPVVEAIILMRPTKSATLLLQMIGRALRPIEGKTAIIMDHAGLHQDHGWFANDWQWSIEGGAANARRMAGGRGPRRCPECKEVRGERLPVCDCGYEFPTGREVGEFDGVLREVAGEVPEGCVTQADFALLNRCSWEAVKSWRQRGMPSVGAYIKLKEANIWLDKNRKKRPKAMPGSESPVQYANRLQLTPSTIYRWIKRGLPIDNDGNIISSLADAWKSIHVDHDKLVHKVDYPLMHGYAKSAIYHWIKMGMPVHQTGKIDPREADDWVSEHVKGKPKNESETIEAFARRVDRPPQTVSNWKKLGLPVDSQGFVVVVEALEWVESWIKGDHRRRPKPNHPEGYEPRKKFCTRIKSFRKLILNDIGGGLPVHADNHDLVHIQRGLEWVRDNTKIDIPPEAWPSANDNKAAASNEAAA